MKKTILILLCGWFAIMATRAQCAAQNEAIQAGEELVYDLKFNWKFIWVAAGQAKMDMQAITYQGKPCFRSNLISVSNRQVDFFFKMRDTLTCITAVVWNLFIFVKEPKRATAIRWTKYGSVIKTGNVLPISVV